jgi:hypothetical protein
MWFTRLKDPVAYARDMPTGKNVEPFHQYIARVGTKLSEEQRREYLTDPQYMEQYNQAHAQ